MKLTLVRRAEEAPTIVSHFFEPEERLDHAPGQYLHYHLPHDDPDDRGDARYFTVASSPSEPQIQLTTRFSDPGSTFKRALRALPLGAAVDAEGLGGSFVLPDDERPALLVAGGIGVTPYRAMLRWLVDEGRNQPVSLLYAARDESDLALRAELEALAAKLDAPVRYVLDRESPSATLVGRLDADRLLQLAEGEPHFYLSGPMPMVRGLKDSLMERGVPEELIKTDSFPGYEDI
jgi:ferredoxin-NADP reductase